MNQFDPSRPALVHDMLKDQVFEWLPTWEQDYRRNAKAFRCGFISWNAKVLDGWQPLLRVVSSADSPSE